MVALENRGIFYLNDIYNSRNLMVALETEETPDEVVIYNSRNLMVALELNPACIVSLSTTVEILWWL